MFNCTTGLYPVSRGEILLVAKPIYNCKPHLIGEQGFARTFQNIRLFANMTALENVLVGRHVRTRVGVFGAVLREADMQAEEAIETDARPGGAERLSGRLTLPVRNT